MDIVSWKQAYSVGNEEIDNEHQVFVRIIQKIHTSVCEGTLDRSGRLLNELIKYADFHFVSEENIMHDMHYADTAAHEGEHKELLAMLRQKLASIRAGEEKIEGIVPVLLDWFVSHTIKRDRQLAKDIADHKGN